MAKFFGWGWLITSGLLAISILVNVILGILLKKKRQTAINDHNKDVVELKKIRKKLKEDKAVNNEKIKNAKNIDELYDTLKYILHNDDNRNK